MRALRLDMRAHVLRRHMFPRLLRLAHASTGNAAIEFALVSTILVLLLLNVVDFSLLIWTKMEVENAAQMGAQAAYATCSSGPLPATTNCANLNSAVTTAVQGTSLSTGVSQASGSRTENYGCTSGTTLKSVGTYSSPPNPFDCSAVGDPSTTPRRCLYQQAERVVAAASRRSGIAHRHQDVHGYAQCAARHKRPPYFNLPLP
jgi:Flp pilus assembly protein TadG